jgi:hypothetical protein
MLLNGAAGPFDELLGLLVAGIIVWVAVRIFGRGGTREEHAGDSESSGDEGSPPGAPSQQG